MAAMNPPMGRRIDATMLAVAGVVPAIVTALLVGNEAAAANDGGVGRVIALRAEPWRATDVLLDSVFACMPLGTRVARAALAGGLVAGVASALLYRMGCALLVARERAPALRFVVAGVAALTATVARPWQTEAAAVGGSVSGALYVLAPVAILASFDDASADRPASRFAFAFAPAAFFALALAFGHEPCVGACALAGCAAIVAVSPPVRGSLMLSLRTRGGSMALAAGAGLAPWFIALLHMRASGDATPLLPGRTWCGETGVRVAGSPAGYVRDHVGWNVVVLALVGLALVLRASRRRPLAAALAVIAIAGLSCAWIGAPVGPTRFGAPLLAASAALGVLAGVTLEALAAAVACARIPRARASAAMVVLLELVLPVDAADDALAKAGVERQGYASAVWNDVAWGTLPPDAVALITSPAILERAVAARAQGEIRSDIIVAPLCSGCPPPWQAFARDPALVAVWRDVALTGAPTEASLSAAATDRTVVLTFEPSWGPAAARHLVPFSLFDRFAPEPRGASDRRRALEWFAPYRERLAELTAFDLELANASASLLRPRALLLAKDPDRKLAERTAADASAFEKTAEPR